MRKEESYPICPQCNNKGIVGRDFVDIQCPCCDKWFVQCEKCYHCFQIDQEQGGEDNG